MREWQSQSHVRWSRRYHVVWVPKYGKRAILGQLRRGIGRIVRALCERHGGGVGGRACLARTMYTYYWHSAEGECGEHGGVPEREVGRSFSSS